MFFARASQQSLAVNSQQQLGKVLVYVLQYRLISRESATPSPCVVGGGARLLKLCKLALTSS